LEVEGDGQAQKKDGTSLKKDGTSLKKGRHERCIVRAGRPVTQLDSAGEHPDWRKNPQAGEPKNFGVEESHSLKQ
jgi:hypothetical protein